MRWLWTALLSLGVGFVAAGGCSGDDDDTSAGGATTTGTGGVGGQGGTLTCDVDFVDLLGTTEACSSCINETCCEQGHEYEADPSRATFFAVQMCAAVEEPFGTCEEECLEPICDDERWNMPLLHECNECLAEHCCNAWNACGRDDSACGECRQFVNFHPALCCGIPAFAALDECLDTQCAAECDQPIMYDCSGGGWGGAGGAAGGFGGAGGAGGASGGAGGAGGASGGAGGASGGAGGGSTSGGGGGGG